jgi:hypothetical protein
MFNPNNDPLNNGCELVIRGNRESVKECKLFIKHFFEGRSPQSSFVTSVAKNNKEKKDVENNKNENENGAAKENGAKSSAKRRLVRSSSLGHISELYNVSNIDTLSSNAFNSVSSRLYCELDHVSALLSNDNSKIKQISDLLQCEISVSRSLPKCIVEIRGTERNVINAVPIIKSIVKFDVAPRRIAATDVSVTDNVAPSISKVEGNHPDKNENSAHSIETNHMEIAEESKLDFIPDDNLFEDTLSSNITEYISRVDDLSNVNSSSTNHTSISLSTDARQLLDMSIYSHQNNDIENTFLNPLDNNNNNEIIIETNNNYNMININDFNINMNTNNGRNNNNNNNNRYVDDSSSSSRIFDEYMKESNQNMSRLNDSMYEKNHNSKFSFDLDISTYTDSKDIGLVHSHSMDINIPSTRNYSSNINTFQKSNTNNFELSDDHQLKFDSRSPSNATTRPSESSVHAVDFMAQHFDIMSNSSDPYLDRITQRLQPPSYGEIGSKSKPNQSIGQSPLTYSSSNDYGNKPHDAMSSSSEGYGSIDRITQQFHPADNRSVRSNERFARKPFDAMSSSSEGYSALDRITQQYASSDTRSVNSNDRLLSQQSYGGRDFVGRPNDSINAMSDSALVRANQQFQSSVGAGGSSRSSNGSVERALRIGESPYGENLWRSPPKDDEYSQLGYQKQNMLRQQQQPQQAMLSPQQLILNSIPEQIQAQYILPTLDADLRYPEEVIEFTGQAMDVTLANQNNLLQDLAIRTGCKIYIETKSQYHNSTVHKTQLVMYCLFHIEGKKDQREYLKYLWFNFLNLNIQQELPYQYCIDSILSYIKHEVDCQLRHVKLLLDNKKGLNLIYDIENTLIIKILFNIYFNINNNNKSNHNNSNNNIKLILFGSIKNVEIALLQINKFILINDTNNNNINNNNGGGMRKGPGSDNTNNSTQFLNRLVNNNNAPPGFTLNSNNMRNNNINNLKGQQGIIYNQSHAVNSNTSNINDNINDFYNASSSRMLRKSNSNVSDNSTDSYPSSATPPPYYQIPQSHLGINDKSHIDRNKIYNPQNDSHQYNNNKNNMSTVGNVMESYENMNEITMLFKHHELAQIIGKRGSILRELKRLTGTEIKVDSKLGQEYPRDAEGAVVRDENELQTLHIRGTNEQIYETQKLISAILAEGVVKALGMMTVHMDCPESKIPLVIGIKGLTCKEMMRRTGCKIHVNESSESSDVNRIELIGTTSQIEQAQNIISLVLEHGTKALGRRFKKGTSTTGTGDEDESKLMSSAYGSI